MLRDGMTPSEGVTALARILQSGIRPRVVVSTAPPDVWMERVNALRRAVDAGGVQTVDGGAEAPHAGFDAVEGAIAGMWHELLGVQPRSLDDEFFELGGHSLMAIRLMSRIERTFHAKLPVSLVFESPRLGVLSGIVRDRIAQGGPATGADEPARASAPDAPAVMAVSREGFRTVLSDLPGDAEEEEA
jgi:hypothetical protein